MFYTRAFVSVVAFALVAPPADTASVGTGTPTVDADTPPAQTVTPTATDAPATSKSTGGGTPPPTDTPTASRTPTPDPVGVVVTVVSIIDGDTVEIEYQNGSRATARLLGVDSPEASGANEPIEFEGVPNSSRGGACLADWGDKATSYTTTTLRGEQVRITFDENEGRRGYYGRLLVYIHHDGKLFNRQLVAEGYARVYDSSFVKQDSFYAVEDTAQASLTGLWECRTIETATPTPTPTETSSGGSGTLEVAEVHADAEGNDHENTNEEYVVFTNTGNSALDLSGWKVQDGADHTYYFPDGFTLGAGDSVTLYTGSGTDTDAELYWGSDSAIWNNGGDTVYVYNSEGELVLEYKYS